MNETQIENVSPEKSDAADDEQKKWSDAMQNLQRIIEKSERKLVYFQNRVKQAQFMDRPNLRKIRAASAQISMHAAHLEALQSELRELERRYSGGIYLRQTKKSDLRRIWGWLNRPRIREILYPVSCTFDAFSLDCQNWITNPKTYAFSILIRRTKTLIGFLVFQSDADSVVVKLIVIQPDYRGRGYGIDALSQAVHFAFEELNAAYVTLQAPPDNDVALGCFEKAGFHYLGYTDDVKPYYTMEIDKDNWARGTTYNQSPAPQRLTVPLGEQIRIEL